MSTGENGASDLTIKLLDEEYTIRGVEDRDHLAEVVESVESRLNREREANPRLTKTQVAVLAALRLADEHCRLRRDHEELKRLLMEAK